jgi:hypothetical protein
MWICLRDDTRRIRKQKDENSEKMDRIFRQEFKEVVDIVKKFIEI